MRTISFIIRMGMDGILIAGALMRCSRKLRRRLVRVCAGERG